MKEQYNHPQHYLPDLIFPWLIYEIISAEVILKSKSGKSFLATNSVTSENIDEFLADKNTISQATIILEDFGFTALESETSISIVGTSNLFEKIFKIKIKINKDDLGNLSVNLDKKPIVPMTLKNYVEAIIFPEKPEYF